GDEDAQGLGVADLAQRLREGRAAVEAEDVADLHEEEEDRRGVLEAGHHRERGELDQRAEADGAEQRLEQAGEDDDGEEDRQEVLRLGGGVGMDEAGEQQAEKEGACDAGA
ncbi:MAG TPA: hypothetical protein VGH62_08350, partial [Bradyrhizobium sp.]